MIPVSITAPLHFPLKSTIKKLCQLQHLFTESSIILLGGCFLPGVARYFVEHHHWSECDAAAIVLAFVLEVISAVNF